jgi:dTDP-4-dehydrorhamnose reductase
MKILLFGRDGQLGRELCKRIDNKIFLSSSQDKFIGLTRADCDVTEDKVLKQILDKIQPDLILNATAYRKVDDSESHKSEAYAVNCLAPTIMAEYAFKNSAVLMHYSTDYVFSGNKIGGYSEKDEANPLNIYGASKRAGEIAIEELWENTLKVRAGGYTIFRTSWLYGEGSNFIKSILEISKTRDQLRIVNDQYGIPTSASWLANLSIDFLIKKNLKGLVFTDFSSGIYHAVPDGQTNWFNLAKKIFSYANELGFQSMIKTPDQIKPITSSSLKRIAKRPHSSVLKTDLLKSELNRLKIDCNFPEWELLTKKFISDLNERKLI